MFKGNQIRKAIVLLLFLFEALSIKAQHYKVKDFIEEAVPVAYTKEWYALNYSPLSFKVALVNNTLVITKGIESDKSTFTLTNGKLEGFNHGEWGGLLLYRPKNGKPDTIKRGNVVAIFKHGGQIYFIEGLAHMGTNEGSLYRLFINGKKFTFSKVFNFQDAPEAYTIYKNAILVAGHNNFYSIVAEKCDLLFKDMFWESLYPNSLAAINEREVYMGIRGGYVKLDIANKSYKFYKYSAKL